ncbi:MAG: LamG-like jellyroll fold domain-containing protein [Myxococcota bacterium]
MNCPKRAHGRIASRVAAAALTLALWGLASPASARPLTLNEIFAMSQHIECVAKCGAGPGLAATYEQHVTYWSCASKCGNAPRLWEKNGVAPVDAVDLELAFHEYQLVVSGATGKEKVCYADAAEEIVVPSGYCVGSICQQQSCSAAQCTSSAAACEAGTQPAGTDLCCGPKTVDGSTQNACWMRTTARPAHCTDTVCDFKPASPSVLSCGDTDGDTIPNWLEAAGLTTPSCSLARPCGFTQRCAWSATLGAGQCVARTCPTSGCTAFHLEVVSQDDTEVLVHAWYDFSPLPARALDMHITFNGQKLRLAQARPLAPLTLLGKELATTYMTAADSEAAIVRLSVFDEDGSHAIPTGPIAEIVFQRLSGEATVVAFAAQDALQAKAIAPLQGSGAACSASKACAAAYESCIAGRCSVALTDDALFGKPVSVKPSSELPTKLRLRYPFDDPAQPRSVARVPDADTLCGLIPECVNASAEEEKSVFLARLARLQDGVVSVSKFVPGVGQTAAYLGGGSDHLRLPVHFATASAAAGAGGGTSASTEGLGEPLSQEQQSFTFSTWFYAEEASASDKKGTPRVLFSHNSFLELTHLGLQLVEHGATDGGSFDLKLFVGSLTQKDPPPVLVTAATKLQARVWHHAALVVDATSGMADVYVDGALTASHALGASPSPIVCPQLGSGLTIGLHEEGDVLGGSAAEDVYVAERKSNRYRIVRLDPHGLTQVVVLSDPVYSYRDPHYSAILDRLVYSSNETGSWEIWLARGDGSGKRRITADFGDVSRGIAARRPRWAPDGSGIVFESNAFDILAPDNQFARVNHLFYIQYDATNDQVAIELPGGSTATQLDYLALLAGDIVDLYRLTASDPAHQHTRARWLVGKSAGSRGILVFEEGSSTFRERTIRRVTIPGVVVGAQIEPITGLAPPVAAGGTNSGEELSLLASHRSVSAFGAALKTTERLFYERTVSRFEANFPDSEPGVVGAAVAEDGAATADGRPTKKVQVRFRPSASHDAKCWDLNGDGKQNAAEDANQDGAWDTKDCHATDIASIHVAYDAARWTPVLSKQFGTPPKSLAFEAGPQLAALGKQLSLAAVEVAGESAVRVQVSSQASVGSTRLAAWGGASSFAVVGQVPPSTAAPEIVGVRAVAAGTNHSLVLGTDGRVTALGDNTYRQASVPSTLATETVVAVAAGSRHSLALTAGGTVVAWGDVSPVIGADGTATSLCTDFPILAGLPTLESGVCSRSGEFCDLDTTSTCTGGTATAPNACVRSEDPARVPWVCSDGTRCFPQKASPCAASAAPTSACAPLANVVAIASGPKHALALRADGVVVAWGCREHNQTTIPAGLKKTTSIAAGDGSSWEVHTDGTVSVQTTGFMAGNPSSVIPDPALVAALTDVAEVAPGTGWAIVRKTGGALQAVGAVPGTVPAGAGFVSVVAAPKYALALSADGKVHAIGFAPDGAPVSGVAAVSAGPTHALAAALCVARDSDGDGGVGPDETCVVGAPSEAPIPANTVLATVHFECKTATCGGGDPFAFRRETRLRDYWVKSLTDPTAPPQQFESQGLFEWVEAAEFGPKGDRLLMSTISNARPVLLRSHDLDDAQGSESLLDSPTRTSGLSWTRNESYYACNWVGGHLHFHSKLYRQPEIYRGHRGGLDDLRIYSGKRSVASIRSEFERGHVGLVAAKMDGQVDSQDGTCGGHVDCPDFHLCIGAQCKLAACDPKNPASCQQYGGRCTLRPVSAGQAESGADGADYSWVCAADCQADSNCYSQECLNGPCTLCDDETKTCVECQNVTTTLGGLTYSTVEGCPDQLRWRCDAGACVSDCFVSQDGESVYVCDPTLEYCDGGECVLHDWGWEDFAPATFSGLGEMRQRLPQMPSFGWYGYSQVVSQAVPITVKAYGIGDYGSSPEIVVEARGGPFFGAEWHEIGRAKVHATREDNAREHRFLSRAVFDDLRVRLITSPYDNPTGASSGLGADDKDFCLSDAKETCKVAPPLFKASCLAVKTAACYRRPAGSLAQLGYVIELPEAAATAACKAQGFAGCQPANSLGAQYLQGGRPAVIITAIQVDGAGVLNKADNTICGYGGYGADATNPLDATGAPKKLFFGDVTQEGSVEKDVYCAANPAACTAPPAGGELVAFPASAQGFGLLNCSYFDPATSAFARVQVTGLGLSFAAKPWPLTSGSVVQDSGDVCLIEDAFGLTEPCYAWLGQDLTVDPQNHPVDTLSSLQFSLFRSFGYDGQASDPLPEPSLLLYVGGFSAADAGLAVRLSAEGKSTDYVVTAANTTLLAKLQQGKRFTVTIASQPAASGGGRTCEVVQAGPQTMGSVATTISVVCGTPSAVQVAWQGVGTGKTAKLRVRATTAAGALLKDAVFILEGAGPRLESFPGGLGASFTAAVERAPDGSVCTVTPASGTLTSGTTQVNVSCQAVPFNALSVAFQNAGGDLTLGLSPGGQTMKVHAEAAKKGLVVCNAGSTGAGCQTHLPDGTSLAFPVALAEGAPYLVVIDALPLKPLQSCEIVNGAGVMGASGPAAPIMVTCTDAPLSAVRGQITGLKGPELALTLQAGVYGSETLVAKATAGALDQPIPYAFTLKLPPGVPYSISVDAQPTSPKQLCALLAPVDTMPPATSAELDAVKDVICVEETELGPTYLVRATISGLKGKGLQLKLSGAETASIATCSPVPAGGCSVTHTFSQPVKDFGAYEVTVDRQPSSPPQLCTVTGGKGEIDGKDAAVTVTCVDGKPVTVHLDNPSADDVKMHVQAHLLNSGGAKVAEQPAGAKLDVTGSVTFELVAPGATTAAAVPAGSYTLRIWLNANMNFTSGLPNFTDDAPTKDVAVTVTNTGGAQEITVSYPKAKQ